MYGIRPEEIYQRLWLTHWPLGVMTFWWQWANNPQTVMLEYWKATAETMQSNAEELDRLLSTKTK
jgi:hypothetical protein